MKNTKAIFLDWGVLDYETAWRKQEELFNTSVQLKSGSGADQQTIPNYIVFCEHPHVYTLGKNGSEQNLLLNHLQLEAKQATFFNTNRGGDITYHGPGQLVGYPIIDLENISVRLKEYIYLLEASIIDVLEQFGIASSRLEGATGVWLDVGVEQKTRKICAIGVKSSRQITMHGFAFNVNTQMEYFNYINPCGFVDKGVTSLSKELNRNVDMEDVKQRVKKELAKKLGLNYL